MKCRVQLFYRLAPATKSGNYNQGHFLLLQRNYSSRTTAILKPKINPTGVATVISGH